MLSIGSSQVAGDTHAFKALGEHRAVLTIHSLLAHYSLTIVHYSLVSHLLSAHYGLRGITRYSLTIHSGAQHRPDVGIVRVNSEGK